MEKERSGKVETILTAGERDAFLREAQEEGERRAEIKKNGENVTAIDSSFMHAVGEIRILSGDKFDSKGITVEVISMAMANTKKMYNLSDEKAEEIEFYFLNKLKPSAYVDSQSMRTRKDYEPKIWNGIT